MARKEPKPAAAMASAGASWRKLGPARELEAEQSSGTTKNSEEDEPTRDWRWRLWLPQEIVQRRLRDVAWAAGKSERG